jgi:hypothetical protein
VLPTPLRRSSPPGTRCAARPTRHNPDVARLTDELRRALGDRFTGRHEEGRALERPAATALLTSERAAADRLGWS